MSESVVVAHYACQWVEFDGLKYHVSGGTHAWGDAGLYAHNADVIRGVRGPIRTVVDIGAHIGFTAFPCVKQWGAQVYAFEANPWTFSSLVLGILENQMVSKVRPFHAAVCGGPPRIVDIRSPRLISGQAGTCQPDNHPIIGRAASVTFEQILALTGPIDLLKLDIEGGEHELLPDVPKAAWEEVDWFHLETHDVEQALHHAAGAKNIDWRALMDAVGFEQINSAVWRRRKAVVG